jgi:hypothetical protein
LRNGPNTYNGDVAGSPPPARAPSKALFSLFDTLTAIIFFSALPRYLAGVFLINFIFTQIGEVVADFCSHFRLDFFKKNSKGNPCYPFF